MKIRDRSFVDKNYWLFYWCSYRVSTKVLQHPLVYTKTRQLKIFVNTTDNSYFNIKAYKGAQLAF